MCHPVQNRTNQCTLQNDSVVLVWLQIIIYLVSYYLVSVIHLTNLVSSSFFSKILSILFSSLLVNVYELTKRGFSFS